MDIAAKKTALSHFLFNSGGVLLFLPVLLIFGGRLQTLSWDPALSLATIHLVFNIVTSLIFMVFIGPFSRLVDGMLGRGKMDFQRLSLPEVKDEQDFQELKQSLREGMLALLRFLQENYNLVSLSIETNYKGIHSAAEKRLEYIEFVKAEYLAYFSRMVSMVEEAEESRQFVDIVNRFDYLFQIHDSIKDLLSTKKVMLEHYIELDSDLLILIRELTGHTLNLFDDIRKSLEGESEINIPAAAKELQHNINEASKDLLVLLADSNRRDVGALINLVTYSQRLKDKLLNFHTTMQ